MFHHSLLHRGIILVGLTREIFGMTKESLLNIQEQLRRFAQDRDWNQFHSPKNLSMALSVEVSEILEHFQWLTEQQSQELSPEVLGKVEFELADAFIYILRLADKLEVDLIDAVAKKIAINESKYPAERVQGSAKKYTDYD